MPRYMPVEKAFRRTLPSSEPGDPAEVWGPGELSYWDETNIRSRSQRTEVNPVTGAQLVVTDSALFEYQLLHTFLEHPKTGWNLFDDRDRPYERTRETIDRLLSGEKGRQDRNYLIAELALAFFPEMVPQSPAPPEEVAGNSRSEPPAETSWTGSDETGSTPTPRASRSMERPLTPIQS